MSRFLAAMARRLRLVWAWATAAWIAPAIAGAALFLVLVGWLQPWSWPEPAALGLVLAAVALVVGWALFQPLAQTSVARAADRGLATKDTFETALHFEALDGPFGERIVERAERAAETAAPAEAAPLRSWGRRWMIAGALAVLALGAALIGNPQDDVRAQRAEDQAIIDDVAERLEERAEELAEDPLTAELAEELQTLAEELRQAEDVDEAAELLEAQEQALAAERPNDFASQQAAAQGLERSLADRPLAGSPESSPAEQLQALAENVGELSEDEQAALAERLEALAEALAAGDPATAGALADAAAALAAGDVAGAQAALGEAALAQGAAAQNVNAQLAADGVAGELGQLAQGLQGQGAGQGQGQGQGAGQGQGQGAGQGEGEGQGSGSGSGGEGGGDGASGEVGGADGGSGSGQGGEGTPGGTDQDRVDTNDGATIVDPVALADGEDLGLGGTPTGPTGEVIGQGQGPTGAGGTRVPVADVVGEYADRATEAADRQQLPPSQQELIGNYFDLLAN